MKIVVSQEELQNGLKIVERATMIKGLQPVLANVFIETIGKNLVKLKTTDFDLTMITNITAQIKEQGKVTVSARKLSDIIMKLGSKDLIEIESDENNVVSLNSNKSHFEIVGISAEEFPNVEEEPEEKDFLNIELAPFVKAIKQASFAAASFETNNLLSGVVCQVTNNMVEIASTDGNRLARAREVIDFKTDETKMLVLPSKTMQELVKFTSYTDEEFVKLYPEQGKIFIKTNNITMISRLKEGQYPKYNQLIPQKSPKEATVNIQKLINSIEKVSTMVDDKTCIIRFSFSKGNLVLKGNNNEIGKSQDEIDIEYDADDLEIAFNFRYVLECLKNMYSENVKIGLNESTTPTVLKPVADEDFICLVMPCRID